MNRWNIPAPLELKILERDLCCVYCSAEFIAENPEKGLRRSWEHIVNDVRVVTEDNIAICCRRCNASKGAKDLRAWLDSHYCKRNGITAATVAAVVKKALDAYSGESQCPTN
jgi:5-methylcytosine-specific restriction endonuclease McrA